MNFLLNYKNGLRLTRDSNSYRDKALRDTLICGLKSKAIHRNLLEKIDLNLKKAVDIAVGIGLIEKEITQLANESPVHKVTS